MRYFLWLILVGVATACNGPEPVSLTVLIRTDYQPVREFLEAEVIVDEALMESTRADVLGTYVRPGQPLAVFERLDPSGRRNVTARLRLADGSTLTESSVLIENNKDIRLTIALSRRCGDTTCPLVEGNAQRCLGGQCVPADCATGTEDSCNITQCTGDDACSTDSPCAKPVCVDFICYDDASASEVCALDEVCDIEAGCVPGYDPCDTVDDCPRDSACVPAVCVVGLCVYSLAPLGAPCEAGGTCNDGLCVGPCANGIQDREETDIDCGGSECSQCTLGERCLVDQDCDTTICDMLDSFRCEAIDTCGNSRVESPELCDDGNLELGDVCGPSCLWGLGQPCTDDNQCDSGYCRAAGICAPATCINGVMDGDETATDCGGSCNRCPPGSNCTVKSDCTADFCDAGSCGPWPAGLRHHRAAFDTIRNEMVMFGGESSAVNNETWTWNGTRWTLKNPSTKPDARMLHGMGFSIGEGRTIVSGGQRANGNRFNDTWGWNGTNWTALTNALDHNTASQLAYHPTTGTIVQMSGNDGGSLSKIHHWKSDAWTFEAGLSYKKNGGTMAFDPANSEMIIFGGTNAGTTTAAMLRSDVVDPRFLAISPPAKPEARIWPGMSGDLERNNVILFGGRNDTIWYGDTWIWDGTTWTKRNPSRRPSMRAYSPMVYDSARKVVLLFGGLDPDLNKLDDLWQWNGTNWTKLGPFL